MTNVGAVRRKTLGDTEFATFSTFMSKACVEHVAAKLDGRWYDVDTGHDWTEGIEEKLADDKSRREALQAVSGLRDTYERAENNSPAFHTITVKVCADMEPTAQLMSVVLDVLNAEQFDLLPPYSKVSILAHLASTYGGVCDGS